MPILGKVLRRNNGEQEREEAARVAERLANLFADHLGDEPGDEDLAAASVPTVTGSTESTSDDEQRAALLDAPTDEAATRPLTGDDEPTSRLGGRLHRAADLVAVMAPSFDEPPDWEALRAMARSADVERTEATEIPIEPDATPATTAVRPVQRPKKPATAKPRVDTPAKRRAAAKSKTPKALPVPCPYCGVLLDLPLPASKRCAQCLHRIVVRHLEGRTVYLAASSAPVFDSERRRIADIAKFNRERARWLRLAAEAGAAPERIERLAAARPSEEIVASARTSYLKAVEQAFRSARGRSDWDAATRIRRKQAADLYRVAGSPMPPTPDIVALLREAVRAELRGIAELSRNAELVSAGCCDVCSADDRQIFRVSTELRSPRLPHTQCAKGLCRCRWTLAARDRVRLRRFIRRPAPVGVFAEPGVGESEEPSPAAR